MLDVESHPERSFRLDDGRLMPDVVFTVTPEAQERMRQGYMCCACLEPFREAWPETCEVCGFTVRADQAAVLAQRMREDSTIVAPGLPMDRERAHLERVAHEVRPAMKIPKGAPKRSV